MFRPFVWKEEEPAKLPPRKFTLCDLPFLVDPVVEERANKRKRKGPNLPKSELPEGTEKRQKCKDEKETKESGDEKGKELSDQKTKEHNDQKAKEHNDQKIKKPNDQKAKEPNDQKTKKPKDQKIKKPNDQKAKEPNDQKAKEPNDQKAKEHNDQKAKEHNDQKAKEHNDQKAKERNDQKAKEDNDQKAKEHNDQKTKEFNVQKTKEPNDQKTKEHNDREIKEPNDQKLKKHSDKNKPRDLTHEHEPDTRRDSTRHRDTRHEHDRNSVKLRDLSCHQDARRELDRDWIKHRREQDRERKWDGNRKTGRFEEQIEGGLETEAKKTGNNGKPRDLTEEPDCRRDSTRHRDTRHEDYQDSVKRSDLSCHQDTRREQDRDWIKHRREQDRERKWDGNRKTGRYAEQIEGEHETEAKKTGDNGMPRDLTEEADCRRDSTRHRDTQREPDQDSVKGRDLNCHWDTSPDLKRDWIKLCREQSRKKWEENRSLRASATQRFGYKPFRLVPRPKLSHHGINHKALEPAKEQTEKKMEDDIETKKNSEKTRIFPVLILSPNLQLMAENDWQKYEKARDLAKKIGQIRETYTKAFKSQAMSFRQRAVAVYFIDKLALRAGMELDDDPANNIGCCQLRYEHVKLHDEKDGVKYVVELDFPGNDSSRYHKEVHVTKRVFMNLKTFMEDKDIGDVLFDRVNTTRLNKHLGDLMEGLRSDIFRTYNSSQKLQKLLDELTPEKGSLAEKVLAYNRACREVAIFCNHRRPAPKSHENSMENLETKIQEKRAVFKKAEKVLQAVPINSKNFGKKQIVVKRLEQAWIREKLNKTNKEEGKEIDILTSRLHYLDPRITVAWCLKNRVPIRRIFNKIQRVKFGWAIDMAEKKFRFD